MTIAENDVASGAPARSDDAEPGGEAASRISSRRTWLLRALVQAGPGALPWGRHGTQKTTIAPAGMFVL